MSLKLIIPSKNIIMSHKKPSYPVKISLCLIKIHHTQSKYYVSWQLIIPSQNIIMSHNNSYPVSKMHHTQSKYYVSWQIIPSQNIMSPKLIISSLIIAILSTRKHDWPQQTLWSCVLPWYSGWPEGKGGRSLARPLCGCGICLLLHHYPRMTLSPCTSQHTPCCHSCMTQQLGCWPIQILWV